MLALMNVPIFQIMFDPHCWGKESYYDELARVQKEEMDKREKERKDKTKVSGILSCYGLLKRQPKYYLNLSYDRSLLHLM